MTYGKCSLGIPIIDCDAGLKECIINSVPHVNVQDLVYSATWVDVLKTKYVCAFNRGIVSYFWEDYFYLSFRYIVRLFILKR